MGSLDGNVKDKVAITGLATLAELIVGHWTTCIAIESKRQHFKSLGHEAFDSHVASKVFWTKVEKDKSEHNSIWQVF